MFDDLKNIHQIIFEAYRRLLRLSNIEIPPLEHD
nr:ORF1 [Salmonella phage PSP3]